MVIENGIDLGRYQPRSDLRAAVRAELGLSAGALVMGTVCRLVEGKNVGLLLRAALPHLGPETHVLIIAADLTGPRWKQWCALTPREDPFTSSASVPTWPACSTAWISSPSRRAARGIPCR